MLSDHATFLRGTQARVRDVVTAIALCHNVTPVILESGTMEYQAASPDEVALVKWTAKVGIALLSRDLHTMRLQGPDKDAAPLEYEVRSRQV
jgi:phospholipid-translocating ATPase